MQSKINTRTVMLAAVALLLVSATVYDYTGGFGTRTPATATAGQQADARTSRVALLSREAAETRHFIAHAPQIRARYHTIAAAYAESVATFATLYSAGASPVEIAKKRVVELLPINVELSDLMVAQANISDKGATWLTATLILSSSDSEAFEKAVLSLGDAFNGTIWKGITITGDAEHRTLRASGQLALLMVEQAE